MPLLGATRDLLDLCDGLRCEGGHALPAATVARLRGLVEGGASLDT